VTSQENHTTILTIYKISDHQNSVRSIYLLVSCERIITQLHQTNAHYTALLKNTTFKSMRLQIKFTNVSVLHRVLCGYCFG